MILSLIKSALCFCLCLSSSLFVYSETFLRPSTSAFITLPSHQIREMKGRPHESNLPLSGEAGSRAQNPHLIHINNTHTHTHSHAHIHGNMYAPNGTRARKHLALYNHSVRQSGNHLECTHTHFLTV